MADNYGTDVQLGADGLNPQFPLISGHRVVGYNFFRRITTPSNLPAYRATPSTSPRTPVPSSTSKPPDG